MPQRKQPDSLFRHALQEIVSCIVAGAKRISYLNDGSSKRNK